MVMSSESFNILRRTLGNRRVKDIPYPTQSIEVEEHIGNRYKDGQDKALFYMLYLGGQRITECLKTTRFAVTTDSREGFEFIIIDSLTEKNRVQPRRTIPIPLYGKEKHMSEYLWSYIDNIREDKALFPGVSRTNAWHRMSKVDISNRFINMKNEIIEKPMKIFCHFQRHCRASHMAMFYGYDIIKLMGMFGWSSPTVPAVYVSLNWVSLAEPMMKKNDDLNGF